MDFISKRKEQSKIQSIGDRFRSGKIKASYNPKKRIKGPDFADCLERPWQRGDLMGVLAGAGVGKTSFTLNLFKHILENNKDTDEVCVFVSLEMTEAEIAEKWFKLVGEDNEISDRLYVIENYDEDQKAKALTSTGIRLELLKLKETLGTGILSFAIDHLHIINIDGAENYNPTCDELKQLAVEVQAFGIVLSQTTKGKGAGDIPVPKDGCYGCSKYEWNCSFIVSLFQPLLKIQSKVDLPVLAWQYSKIRYKNRGDKVKETMNYLLKYNFENESLIELTRDEKAKFSLHYEEVLLLRQNEEKFKTFQFDLSETVKGKDGKTVRLDRIVGGSKPEFMDDEL